MLKCYLPMLYLLLTWFQYISGVPPRSPQPKKSPMALYMDSQGLINVTELDNSLAVQLMYTQDDNFTGEVLYDNLTEAYLHPDAAYALVKAQRALKELHPSYSLIIYDAARPMSEQKKMWNEEASKKSSRKTRPSTSRHSAVCRFPPCSSKR